MFWDELIDGNRDTTTDTFLQYMTYQVHCFALTSPGFILRTPQAEPLVRYTILIIIKKPIIEILVNTLLVLVYSVCDEFRHRCKLRLNMMIHDIIDVILQNASFNRLQDILF